MGEKTQENSGMGYSAAYPTGRERIVIQWGSDGVESGGVWSEGVESGGVGDFKLRGFDRIEIGREGEI